MNRGDWHHVELMARYYGKIAPPGMTALGWQLIKLMEESGEVATNFIGYSGQNPRKGDVVVTIEDVVKEICDVIITGMVALSTTCTTPEATLNHRFQIIRERTQQAVLFNE
jgi:hypothetical protein